MKKILSLVLALSLASTLSGCVIVKEGNGGSDSKVESKYDSKPASKEDSKPASKEDSKPAGINNSVPAKIDSSRVEDNPEPPSIQTPEPPSIQNTESSTPSGNPEKTKQAILQYANVDLLTLADFETQMLNSYNSVSGTNYTSDAAMYTELTTVTLPVTRKLNTEAITVAANLTDPELIAVHKLYVQYTGNLLSAFGLMITAIEKQDMATMISANDKLNEANAIVMDYNAGITSLLEKYDLTTNTVI